MAELVPALPNAADCRGDEEQRRTCYQMQWALWANSIMGLYKGEVVKRQTQDECLDQLRRDGVIR